MSGCEHNSMWACNRCARDRDHAIITDLRSRLEAVERERDEARAALKFLNDTAERWHKQLAEAMTERNHALTKLNQLAAILIGGRN